MQGEFFAVWQVLEYWCLLQQFPSQPWPSRPKKWLMSCHVARIGKSQHTQTPGVSPTIKHSHLFYYCYFWNWHKKRQEWWIWALRASSPYIADSHTCETAADFKDKTPWSWVQLGGCQKCPRPPWFLSDKCKATKEGAKLKERDLVYVANIKINNQSQIFQICSNSQAD